MGLSLKFYEEVGKLKRLRRTGWVNRSIPDPETVAEHMYRSQFVAYDLAKKMGADPVACASMMMLHDLSEARVGDITPEDGVSKEEKLARETRAMRALSRLSDNPEFLDVFREYEEKQTLRARICNDADQLECLIQALEYARQYPEKIPLLENFWSYAQARLLTEPGKAMFAELITQKNALRPRPARQTSIQAAGALPARRHASGQKRGSPKNSR